MPDHDIIVIGASAGGINALKQLVGNLPASFQTPIFIVQHLSPYRKSYLPEILSKAGPIPALHPFDEQKIETGKIYVAPPDHHMLIENDYMLVKKGPKENRFRPSIDALFRSASYYYGEKVTGIVLTGMLDDGTSGLWSIKHLGGITIVQDPDEAEYSSMPKNAITQVDVDFKLSLGDITQFLISIDHESIRSERIIEESQIKHMKTEIDIAAERNALDKGVLNLGEPSSFTCPECGGGLIEINEGRTKRYRCHTGHAYSPDSLLEETRGAIDARLTMALRKMNEAIMLLQKSAEQNHELGQNVQAEALTSEAKQIKERAEKLHNFIFVDVN